MFSIWLLGSEILSVTRGRLPLYLFELGLECARSVAALPKRIVRRWEFKASFVIGGSLGYLVLSQPMDEGSESLGRCCGFRLGTF